MQSEATCSGAGEDRKHRDSRSYDLVHLACNNGGLVPIPFSNLETID
jgi:hypothetical protein